MWNNLYMLIIGAIIALFFSYVLSRRKRFENTKTLSDLERREQGVRDRIDSGESRIKKLKKDIEKLTNRDKTPPIKKADPDDLERAIEKLKNL